jgi:hypothetical protein
LRRPKLSTNKEVKRLMKKKKYKSHQLNFKGSTSKKFQHSTQKAGDEEVSMRRLLVITVNAEVK